MSPFGIDSRCSVSVGVLKSRWFIVPIGRRKYHSTIFGGTLRGE